MDTTELRMRLTVVLEEYEEGIRRYCDKVEQDRPWVASAIWQATWEFRLTLLRDITYLDEKLAEAKRLKDPG